MCLNCASPRSPRGLLFSLCLTLGFALAAPGWGANSNPTVTFTTNTNQTNPAGRQFRLQLFAVSDATNIRNLFVSNRIATNSTNTPPVTINGVTVVTNIVTYSSTNSYTNSTITVDGSFAGLGIGARVTNGLVFYPETGLLMGTPTTNFILSFGDLQVSTTNQTWSTTNFQTNRVVTINSNGKTLPSQFFYGSASSVNSPTNTNTATFLSTDEFRLVFQLPALITNFPITNIGAFASTNLPSTNEDGLLYGYELLSGQGTLTGNTLTSTGLLPVVLRASLTPTSPALEIWRSNSTNLIITKTDPNVIGFGFATNTNLPAFTRTNLVFQASTPLLVTNASIYRPVFTVSPAIPDPIFYGKHPTIPNLETPYLRATAGTGSLTVDASVPGASAVLTISLTQAPAPTITMLGVFTNTNSNPVGGAFTNTNPAITMLPLLAYSSSSNVVAFVSTDTNVARITNENRLVMVGSGTCNILASNLFLDTNNYLEPPPVTNLLVVSWTNLPIPVFSSTNRQDAIQGVPFTYLLRAGPATNTFPITYGVTNLPPGLVFVPPNQVVGIPALPGLYRMQLTAANSNGSNTNIVTNILTTLVAPGGIVSVTNSWIYHVALGTGTNTNGTYSFPAGLPAGITSLTNASVGAPPVLVLSNANTNPATNSWFAGITNFAVVFSNSQTNFTNSVPLNVRPPAPLVLSLPATNSNNAGIPLQVACSLTPTGVEAVPGYPVSFFAVNLPGGLVINRTSGIIAGTPTAQNSIATLWATNIAGSSVTNTNASFVIQPVAGVFLQRSLAFTNAAGIYGASNLPAGLSLQPSTGLLYGIPLLAISNTNIVVTFVAAGGTNIFTRTSPLTIYPAVPEITSTNRAEVTQSLPVSYLMKANLAPATFGATNLPPGLFFTNGDQIAGTPSQPGTFRSRLTVSNLSGITTNILTWVILPNPVFSVTNGWNCQVALGSGTNTNGAYTFLAPLPAGIGSVTQTVSGMAPVLVLSNTNTNGNLIGTNSSNSFAGITNISVVFTSAQTNFTSPVSLNVRPVAPSLTVTSTVTGVAGTAFSMSLSSGVDPAGLNHVQGYPLGYSASNLPAGLGINPTSGVIAGTPAAGTWTSRIQVSNAVGGAAANVTFQFGPVAGSPLQISLASTNGAGTYRATNLPPGLFLNASSGLLYGSPQAVGTFPIEFSFTPSGSRTPLVQPTTNLTILPAVPVLVLPSTSIRTQAGQPFFLQPYITGPGWGWAGADPLTGTRVNTANWSDRLLVGARNVVLSSNSNGAILASTNGFTFTNNSNSNSTGLLWISNLPSASPWQAFLRMRIASTNPWAGPFLGLFRAPTNYARQFVEGVLQAGTNGVLPGAWFGNTNTTNALFAGTGVGTNEVTLRMVFDTTNNRTLTVAASTNPTTNTFTNLLVFSNLQNAWGLTNPIGDFRIWVGGDFSGRSVQRGDVLLRNFLVLPLGVTFSALNLPQGLFCDSNTGTIYGVPTVAPDYRRVILSAGNAQGTNSRTLDLYIDP